MSKKKTKNLKYLDELREPLESTMKEFSLKRSEAEDVLDHFFNDLRLAMQDKRMPKIKITNLGTFTPNIRKVEYYIRKAISGYRKGRLTKEACDERIIRLWMVRRRLQAESRGESTYKEWTKKDIEYEVQCIQDQKSKGKESQKGEIGE